MNLDKSNLQHFVGEIFWGNNILIFFKCRNINEQELAQKLEIQNDL